MGKIDEAASGATVAGLADVLEALGDELRDANNRIAGSSNNPLLGVNTAEVELSVSAQADGRGGINIWVVEASAGAKVARTGTIRVAMTAWDGPIAVGE